MSAADNDPSMDDILASIRKIISDDEARAQVGGNPMPPPAAANLGDRPAAPGPRGGLTGNREDVLLLTDLIEEPKAAPAEVPQPVPLPRIDPVRASEMPQPAFESPPPAPATPSAASSAAPSAPSPAGPAAPAFETSIVASSAAGAASSAFDRLNQVVEERRAAPPPAAPAPVSMPAPAIGAGGKTIEDLVKEMLRPMLKDWIDRSLPPMVERLVEREIARLTRR